MRISVDQGPGILDGSIPTCYGRIRLIRYRLASYRDDIPSKPAALRSGQLGVDQGSGRGVLREGIRGSGFWVLQGRWQHPKAGAGAEMPWLFP